MMEIDNIFGKIETCNPVYGCTVNPPCRYCYAREYNEKYGVTPDFSIPKEMPQALKKIHTKKSKIFFMNSMSDLSSWRIEWRNAVFDEISKYPNNIYIFLTKRPENIYLDVRSFQNVWMGVTVTNQEDLRRIPTMFENMLASHYLVCFEPLHGMIDPFDMSGIDWVIVGGESPKMNGNKRPGQIMIREEWIDRITEIADRFRVPVSMKKSLSWKMKEKFRQDIPNEFMEYNNLHGNLKER